MSSVRTFPKSQYMRSDEVFKRDGVVDLRPQTGRGGTEKVTRGVPSIR